MVKVKIATRLSTVHDAVDVESSAAAEGTKKESFHFLENVGKRRLLILVYRGYRYRLERPIEAKKHDQSWTCHRKGQRPGKSECKAHLILTVKDLNKVKENSSVKLIVDHNSLVDHKSYYVANGDDDDDDDASKFIERKEQTVRQPLSKNDRGRSKLFKCHVCSKTFSKPFSLKQHIYSLHDEKEWTCMKCDAVFRRRHQLYFHRRSHGQAFYLPSTEDELISKIGDYDDNDKCSHCSKTFASAFELKEHVEEELNLRSFNCDKCGMESVGRENATNHSASHAGITIFQVRYNANNNRTAKHKETGKIDTSNNNKIANNTTHNDDNDNTANNNANNYDEDDGATNNNDLVGSDSSNCINSPLKCPIGIVNASGGDSDDGDEGDQGMFCQVEDTKRGFENTKNHVIDEDLKFSKREEQTVRQFLFKNNRGGNKKLLKCHVCSKTFSKHFLLKHHIDDFHDEKEWTCMKCDRVFFKRSQLYFHRKRHGQAFYLPSTNNKLISKIGDYDDNDKCSHCSKTFASSFELKEHMEEELNLRSFICDKCGMESVGRENATNHSASHSGITIFQVRYNANNNSTANHKETGKIDTANNNKFANNTTQNDDNTANNNANNYDEDDGATNNNDLVGSDSSNYINSPLKRPIGIVNASGGESDDGDKGDQGMFCQVKDSKRGFENTKNHVIDKREEQTVRVGNKKLLKCHVCSKTFYNHSVLKHHFAYIHDEKEWTCMKCDRVFLKKKQLYYHGKSHGQAFYLPSTENKLISKIGDDDDSNKCSYCPKTFASAFELKEHVEEGHNLRRFVCDKCGMESVGREDATFHSTSHVGIKIFQVRYDVININTANNNETANIDTANNNKTANNTTHNDDNNDDTANNSNYDEDDGATNNNDPVGSNSSNCVNSPLKRAIRIGDASGGNIDDGDRGTFCQVVDRKHGFENTKNRVIDEDSEDDRDSDDEDEDEGMLEDGGNVVKNEEIDIDVTSSLFSFPELEATSVLSTTTAIAATAANVRQNCRSPNEDVKRQRRDDDQTRSRVNSFDSIFDEIECRGEIISEKYRRESSPTTADLGSTFSGASVSKGERQSRSTSFDEGSSRSPTSRDAPSFPPRCRDDVHVEDECVEILTPPPPPPPQLRTTSTSSSPESPSKNIAIKREKLSPSTCFLCYLTFDDGKNGDAYRTHLLGHLDNFSGKCICPICLTYCETNPGMGNHFMMVHGKVSKLVCPDKNCVKTFWTESALIRHEKVH